MSKISFLKMAGSPAGTIIDKNLVYIDNNKDNQTLKRNGVKNGELLDSWKAIASYLDRDIRTCSRWEKKLGLPVHRIDDNSSRSKVFAYRSEIDRWLKEKAGYKELQKKSFLKNKWVIAGLISVSAVILVVVSLSVFFNWSPFSSSAGTVSLAVLPFENHNASEYDEYIADGITHELTDSLTRQSTLKVIPAYPGSGKSSADFKQIGEELGADYVLSGKITKAENNIKITAQLARTKDSKTMWDSEYDGKLEDIFSIQENIRRKINETLNTKPNSKAASLYGKTRDLGAYDSYLKGSYILSRSENSSDPWKLYHQGKYYSGKFTQESNELALNLFNQAIEMDSSFALAYIGLAQCYSHYVNFNWYNDIKWLEKAENLLDKAQSISPDLPEYYCTLTEVYILKELCFNENTITAAFDIASEGIVKYPNHAQLNSILGYCYYMKFGQEGKESDFKKALEYKERSFWLNPYSLSNIVYAELLMLNKEFYKAIHVCDIVKKHDPSLLAKFRLGEIYYYLGDLEKSEAIFQQFDNSPLNLKIDSLLQLGMISSRKRDKKEALGLIDEISRISTEEYIVDSYLNLASIYMGIDMKGPGYEYLYDFFSNPLNEKFHFINLKYIDIDRNFDKVREEKKFQKILKIKEKTNG